ncbi:MULTISPECIES: TerC family protein [unclassified Roseofilum]|uniref:TerC family protein n=1 Tax=unclassified Roseofilum TaxID=2620099 RepID=UPI000E93B2C8|nr:MULTISPECIES: hypothetical protein [unclassified Roseofilum]HBQ99702.1 hypothetical protein [Cyanobacteria bacterium UBA11691]MBP0010273.1 hypothetical protein [Roseofilum sp. Belize Diploria]MBP0012394.1 hypothetical protein [Roseofilum sp. SID3]MBP0025740.1 hypothetical protein [Roseofilum sp. SID2]MBP0034600.1 hypothetical protein [Roseofilum sp. Belize BBD 4]
MLDVILDFSHHFGLDTLFLIIILVALEAVLSADNAVALASISKGLESQKHQQQALNFGLAAAFILRIILILTATWVIRFWQFEFLGAVYLLWLVFNYFTSDEEEADRPHHGPKFQSLWQAVPLIAVTDLAFSLDSVTTAIAITDEIVLVLMGGILGIVALRFLANLFIRWLDEFENLEDAGYITVAFVGLRLLAKVITPDIVPPEWLMISLILLTFVWGFWKPNLLKAN